MGYRCHVATKYDVKYDHGFMSYQQDCINHLLNDLCPGLWCNSEYIESADTLEIPKDEFEQAIKKVKKCRKRYARYLEEGEAEFSVEELISSLETWLENSDPNNDFVRLYWFQ